jgi:hypothetical protein
MSTYLDEDERIIQVFAKRKRIQYILTLPVVAVIVLLLIARVNPDFSVGPLSRDVFIGILIVLAVAALVFSLFNWRCPACNKYLGREFSPKHCSSCGKKLQRD